MHLIETIFQGKGPYYPKFMWGMTQKEYLKKFQLTLSLNWPLENNIIEEESVDHHSFLSSWKVLFYMNVWSILPIYHPHWRYYLGGKIGHPFLVIHLVLNIFQGKGSNDPQSTWEMTWRSYFKKFHLTLSLIHPLKKLS
jgi:hypothetical protein